MEVPRDLKRMAGVVYHYGWETNPINGKKPIGMVMALSGPTYFYDEKMLEYGLPGYYSKADIDLLVDILYHEVQGFLKIPDHIQDSDSFVQWCRGFNNESN